MAISHADHDHPNTPAARAKCRAAMAKDGAPLKVSGERALAESAGLVKPTKMTVVPRTRGDGGVVKGLKATKPHAAFGNVKKPGTVLRGIGDLPDVPRMLAYGARMAWGLDWEVRVGEQFNDNEARIVIKAPACEIAMVWKPSLPEGVWGIFVRNWNSSRTFRVDSVQYAFEVAATGEAWDKHGNLIRS